MTDLRTTLRSRRAGSPDALVLPLAVAAAGWFVVLPQVGGMDMGVATDRGDFWSFLTLWVAMMAAMMLPGTVGAVPRSARVTPFVLAYLAVWTAVGLVAYPLCGPHGTTAAGLTVLAAAAYQVTPLQRWARVRCALEVRSGLRYGLACVRSSAGLMAVLLAVGFMNPLWMVASSALALVQKLVPPRAVVDLPIAFALAALGVLILCSPGTVPGLT